MIYQTLKTILVLCAALLPSQLITAQTVSLPYHSGFDTEEERANWQQIKKGIVSPSIPQEWAISTSSPHAGSHCIYHGYPVGGVEQTDNWMVSPGFEIPEGGHIDSVYHHFSGMGVPLENDTVAIYLLVGDPDPGQADEKILLKDFRGDHYQNDWVWRKSSAIVLPAREQVCYIGFRYTTVVNWLDVRYDDIHISSNTPSSAEKIHWDHNKISIYPNPLGDHALLRIDSKYAFETVDMFTITGQHLLSMPFRSELDLNSLSRGHYILSLQDRAGNRYTHLIHK